MRSIRERVEWAKLNNVRYLFDLSFFEVDCRQQGYSTMAGRGRGGSEGGKGREGDWERERERESRQRREPDWG